MKRIAVYGLAVFLGAMLLFALEPMCTKVLLPSFGGSYLVWGAAMVFFQIVLLAAYLYVHLMHRWLSTRIYARWHLLLLLVPLLMVPRFLAGMSMGEVPSGPLVFSVLVRLMDMVGFPFFVVATTGVLLQQWLAASSLPERTNPYVLYSASNLGSMIGLLGYPVLIEPWFSLEAQAAMWWFGYVVLGVLQVVCASGLGLSLAPAGEARDGAARPGRRQMAGWLVLSTATCAAFLSVTNVLTLDVASAPFLWVLPLAVYLLTFVLAFRPRPFRPVWLGSAFGWAALVGVLLYLLPSVRLTLSPAWVPVLAHLGVLFVVVLAAHVRLADGRPEASRHLTLYYLVIAVGGVVGGVLVSWILPLVTSSLMEYPLSLALVAWGLALASPRRSVASVWRFTAGWAVVAAMALTLLAWLVGLVTASRTGLSPVLLAAIALPVALALRAADKKPAALAVLLAVVSLASQWTEGLAMHTGRVLRLRNYYGIYQVFDRDGNRYLQHGTTQHGRQYLAGPKSAVAQAYYHPTAPVPELLQAGRERYRNVGMIGLGAGAVAVYMGSGQHFTIYELDPDNVPIAEKCFGYLAQGREQGAVIDLVIGDGRLSMAAVPPGSLDVLIIDAFNSGSIPAHLLTTEAFTEYARALKPSGFLLLHLSNKVLDLFPVVYSNAEGLGMHVLENNNVGRRDPDAEDTFWAAVAVHGDALRDLRALGWWGRRFRPGELPRAWTDHYCNILGAIVRR